MRAVNGDPTKSDTARVANASNELLKQLIAAGYTQDSSENIKSHRKYDKLEKADRGFFADNNVSFDEIIEGMNNKPLLALQLFDYFFENNDHRINSLTKSQLKDIQSAHVKASETLNSHYKRIADAYDKMGGSYSSEAEEIRKIVESTLKDVQRLKAFDPSTDSGKSKFLDFISWRNRGTNFNVNTQKLISDLSNRIDLNDPANTGLFTSSEKSDIFRAKRGWVADSNFRELASLVADSNPDALDAEELEDLFNQGYRYKTRLNADNERGWMPKGKISASSAAKQLANSGISAYNSINNFFNSEKIVEDRGDKGIKETVVNPDQIEKYDNYANSTDSFSNVYPSWKITEHREELPFERNRTNYYEDLGDGFYSDREKGNDSRVVNEEISPALFHEGITPNRKVRLWNEALKDLVDLYVYDSPDMRSAAGITNEERAGGSDGFPLRPTATSTAKKVEKLVEPKKKQSEKAAIQGRPKTIKKLEPIRLKRIETDYVRPELQKIKEPYRPLGRFPIQIGRLSTGRENSRYGQVLDSEYIWDQAKKKWQRREVDEERKGHPFIKGSF
jgi:hypothetical protein